MKKIILSESANTGIGLWTSICVAFATVFGVQSKNLKAKQERIVNQCILNLNEKMIGYPNYEAVDLEVKFQAKLEVTVSVLLMEKEGAPAPQIEITESKPQIKKEEDGTVGGIFLNSEVVANRDIEVWGKTIKKGTTGVVNNILKESGKTAYLVAFDTDVIRLKGKDISPK